MMADYQRETPSSSSRRSRGADSNERDSLRQDARRRSSSPRRDSPNGKPRRKDTGFRWKENRRDDDDQQGRVPGLQRGYRDHYRPRLRSRSPRPRSPRREERQGDTKRQPEEKPERNEKKKERKPAAATQQEMIVVTVNDRLGTKKAIPCFASDSVRDFKIIVASMIGRKPHEILLKRQGERPFKDQLTLQDYGVSNNVQLDLEVDTGD